MPSGSSNPLDVPMDDPARVMSPPDAPGLEDSFAGMSVFDDGVGAASPPVVAADSADQSHFDRPITGIPVATAHVQSTDAVAQAQGRVADERAAPDEDGFLIDRRVPWGAAEESLGIPLPRRPLAFGWYDMSFASDPAEREYKRFVYRRGIVVGLLCSVAAVAFPLFLTLLDDIRPEVTVTVSLTAAALAVTAILAFCTEGARKWTCYRLHPVADRDTIADTEQVAAMRHMLLAAVGLPIFAIGASITTMLAAKQCATPPMAPPDPESVCTDSYREAFSFPTAAIFYFVRNPRIALVWAFVLAALIPAVETLRDDYTTRSVAVRTTTAVCFSLALFVMSLWRDLQTRSHFAAIASAFVLHREQIAKSSELASVVSAALPLPVAVRIAQARDPMTNAASGITTYLAEGGRLASDTSLAAVICVTQPVDFDSFAVKHLAHNAVSGMSHLFTLFDMGARVFGVDSGGFTGDAYLVTAGLLAESQATMTNAMRYVMWQHALDEAQVLPLRSAVALGTAQSGLVGKQQLRYQVSGPAVSGALRMLQRGRDGDILATKLLVDRLGDLVTVDRRDADVWAVKSMPEPEPNPAVHVADEESDVDGAAAVNIRSAPSSLATPLLNIVSTDDHVPVAISGGVFTDTVLERAFIDHLEASLHERGYLGAVALAAVAIFILLVHPLSLMGHDDGRARHMALIGVGLSLLPGAVLTASCKNDVFSNQYRAAVQSALLLTQAVGLWVSVSLLPSSGIRNDPTFLIVGFAPIPIAFVLVRFQRLWAAGLVTGLVAQLPLLLSDEVGAASAGIGVLIVLLVVTLVYSIAASQRTVFGSTYAAMMQASAAKSTARHLEDLAGRLMPAEVAKQGIDGAVLFELQLLSAPDQSGSSSYAHSTSKRLRRLAELCRNDFGNCVSDGFRWFVVAQVHLVPLPGCGGTDLDLWRTIDDLLMTACEPGTATVLRTVSCTDTTITVGGPFADVPTPTSARAALQFIATLAASVAADFQVVAGVAVEEALGTIMGSGSMRYGITGPAARHASALGSAATGLQPLLQSSTQPLVLATKHFEYMAKLGSTDARFVDVPNACGIRHLGRTRPLRVVFN